jgi:hypothetical protein
MQSKRAQVFCIAIMVAGAQACASEGEWTENREQVQASNSQALTPPPAPAPAGGLTAAEKASIQNLIWAAYGHKAGDVGSVHDGVAAVLGLVTRDQTTGATRGPLQAVWSKTVQAQHEISLALSDLLGAGVNPFGQPRAFYVNRAKARITQTKNVTLPALQSAANQAIAAGATGSGTGTMQRFRDLHVAGAISKLGAFNQSLAYADPYPIGRRGNRITIIGPHGDYVRVQIWLANAFDRLNRMYTAAIAGYGADALLSGYNNKYQQLKFSSLLVQKIGITMGSVAGLQFSGFSGDPFFRILAILENLAHGGGGPTDAANDCAPDFCHGASYDFNNMKLWTQGDASQESTRPTFKAQQAVVMSEVTEAWQATDTAAWYFLKFPEGETATGGR